MLVRDLKKLLDKCDEDANVCVESFDNPTDIKKVIQYDFDSGTKDIYICDSEKYIDKVLRNVKQKKEIK